MNFRKSTALMLAFIMLISNIDLAFSVHYCGSNISSIGVYEHKPIATPKSCCAINSSNDKKCCSEKVIRIKDGSERIAEKIFFPQNIDILFLPQQTNSPIIKRSAIAWKDDSFSYYCKNTGPPLFKLFSQFIFYA